MGNGFTGSIDVYIKDTMNRLDAGEDPRRAMFRLNRRIVACQEAGQDVPAGLLRLSQRLAAECVTQSHGR